MARHGYRPGKRIRVRGWTARLIVVGLVLCCVVLVVFCGYVVVRSMGKASLSRHASQIANSQHIDRLNQELNNSGEVTQELEEGQILVDGEVYQYNEDIMTFLCMGIDSRSGISDTKTPGKGGQADALLLIVVNPHDESIKVININRDTMINIETYDTAGIYVGEEYKQITLQYAYGNGREGSCRLMEEVVSNLFYGIPIHGYGALDMESISTLNDAVGGVEVTIQEDLTRYNQEWTEGSRIQLQGEEALMYVQRRDFYSNVLGTNIKRMERQKQYLTAFVKQLKEKMRENVAFPLELYGQVESHVVTSLTLEEITYLATTLIGYEFSTEQIISIPGESVMGEANEEFYVDETALREIVIDVFYEKYE